MKQLIQRCGKTVLLLTLLLALLLTAGPVYAVNASAELFLPEAQDPDNGVLYISFSIQADVPATLSADVSVNGGVFLGITAPDCLVRNKRIVYNNGTQSSVSGIIRIGVSEITDITITVSGYVSSVYDFSTSIYDAYLTVPPDQLAGFIPQAYTEPAAEAPGSASYLTLPAGNDPDQSARDASIAELIREEQAARAASEAIENQAEAERMRAADASRLADEEAERRARGQQAGILPRHEKQDQAAATEEAVRDSGDSADISSDVTEAVTGSDDTDPDIIEQVSGSEKTAKETDADDSSRSSDSEQRSYELMTSYEAGKTDEAEETQEKPMAEGLTAADRLLIAGGILAILVFIVAMVNTAVIYKKNRERNT